jgi:hypothetical protein
LVGKPEGRDHLEDLDVDGKIVLEWTEFIWFRIGYCEHCNVPSSSVKVGKFLE